MDKNNILDDIFKNDPLGLLKVKPKQAVHTADERLLSSFQEINDFIVEQGKEPEANVSDIGEFKLYARLKNLKEDEVKIAYLKEYDQHNLLPSINLNQVNEPIAEYAHPKEINSIDDLLNDDLLNNMLDGDSEGLFDFEHIPKEQERAEADFVARRKPCKDFDKYEPLFKEVQKDLKEGKRQLIAFKEDNIVEGEYYVHNGVLMLLESINISQTEQSFNSGKRTRKDGRTKCVFENGTVSNMLYRSLAKILYTNGRVVTQTIDQTNNDFITQFSEIDSEDEAVGYIYILQSMSNDSSINSIEHLYKIGYSTTEVTERIKNAEKEPTYLMAPVRIKGAWKCYNMNPQKLEQLIHNFFGSSCLEINVVDKKGKRHRPREWFIVPLNVIEQAITYIISREIVDYLYDAENMIIVKR